MPDEEHNRIVAPGLKCSFCGRGEAAVRKLIAGPKVLICDDCVDVCNKVLEADAQSSRPGVTFAPQRWFVAVLVVESRLPDSGDKVLVDLQYKLLAAADPEDAYRAALELGK